MAGSWNLTLPPDPYNWTAKVLTNMKAGMSYSGEKESLLPNDQHSHLGKLRTTSRKKLEQNGLG